MKYRIELKSFEGPMELLLHLIKEAEVDIYDIPINQITYEFLEHLNLMEELNLDVTSEFLFMASSLIEIKSKMMLPKKQEEDQEEDKDPRENLVRQIIEYKKYKEVSEELKLKGELQSKIYYKPKEELLDQLVDFQLEDMDVAILLKSINNIIKNKSVQERTLTINEIQRDEYSLEVCIVNIRSRLKLESEFKFTSLLSTRSHIEEIVTYFLSLLELAKESLLYIEQEDFSDLLIIRRS